MKKVKREMSSDRTRRWRKRKRKERGRGWRRTERRRWRRRKRRGSRRDEGYFGSRSRSRLVEKVETTRTVWTHWHAQDIGRY